MLTYTVSGKDITVLDLTDGRSYTVSGQHESYDKLKQSLRDQNREVFLALLQPAKRVADYVATAKTGGKVTVVDGEILYEGKSLHNYCTDKILALMKAGFPIEGKLRFIENIEQNPSYSSREELYQFLEANNLPITEDGYFIAYKSVNENYKDKWTGTYDNTVGAKQEMPRNQVDDNRNNACSKGFHCGGLSYAGPGGWYNSSTDKVIIVKVNPRDAVCVPLDYNLGKLRVCRYEVVRDYFGELSSPLYSASAETVKATLPSPEVDVVVSDTGVGVEHVYEFDAISFDYLALNGQDKRRYAYVDEDHGDKFSCELIPPESHAGEMRNFVKSKMRNVTILS